MGTPKTQEELANWASSRYHSLADQINDPKKKKMAFNIAINEARLLFGDSEGGISEKLMLYIYNKYKQKEKKPEKVKAKEPLLGKLAKQLNLL